MSSKIKIVYCIGGTFNSGGMERVLANKANHLVGRGFEVSIVTTEQQARAPYFTLDPRITCYDLGINYTANHKKSLLQKVLSYPAMQRKHKTCLRKLLLQLKADVVISMFDHEADLLWRIADGSKKVLEIHFSRFKRLQYGRSGLWKWVDTWRSRQDLRVARRYDKFVVLTEEDKAYWGELPNITAIPNAHSFSSEIPAALTAKRVIAVGRYDYQKGFDRLIAAWVRVYEACPDWQLHIFGDGELKKAYEQQIQDLGLQGVVKLCPPTADIQKEYLNSSILAMTSRYEGLPMALLEAQACGLPLVAYACKCGPRDIIVSGENGFLLTEGNTVLLASTLVFLMEDDQLRHDMGTNARRLSARFAEEPVMQRWINLFTELTQKPSNHGK